MRRGIVNAFSNRKPEWPSIDLGAFKPFFIRGFYKDSTQKNPSWHYAVGIRGLYIWWVVE